MSSIERTALTEQNRLLYQCRSGYRNERKIAPIHNLEMGFQAIICSFLCIAHAHIWHKIDKKSNKKKVPTPEPSPGPTTATVNRKNTLHHSKIDSFTNLLNGELHASFSLFCRSK